MVLTPNRASTTKAAYLPAWGERRLSLSELAAELDRPGKGIGVVLGEPSDGLVDVDLDHPAAVAAADALLPPTDLVSGRTGRPRTHRFYRSPGAVSAAFKAGATGMLVELRANGCQTVLPPSPHPDGGYHWDAEGDPARVGPAELRRLTGRIAAAAFLMTRGWPVDHAVAFVRRPDLARTARWERDVDGCPPLRAWLSEEHRRSPLHRPADTRSGIAASMASPYTRAILERIDSVVAAARLLGLELREGHQPCPWHRCRGARALQVAGPLWRCYAGCGSGNAIHLVARALDVSYREARNDLAARLGISWRGATTSRAEGGGVKRPRRRERGTPVSPSVEAGESEGAERSGIDD